MSSAEDGGDWEPVAVRLLGVEQTRVQMGTVEHVTDADAFGDAGERFGFTGMVPQVDFETHVVVLLSRAEDGCPELVGGLQVDTDTVAIDW